MSARPSSDQVGPMRASAQSGRIARFLRLAWCFLRQVSGDDAYERYLQHMRERHAGETPMTRAEHFRFCQEQKWSRVSRCC